MLLLLLAFAWAAPAMAFGIMDPFNLGPAMDGGAVKIGDGIPYGAGPRKVLDVYVPKNPTGPAPVLFFIYGGGWDHGDRGDYQFVGNAFASRGFVVVIPDYRLYPEVKYPDFLEDNAQAVRWVQDNIAKYGGDTDRLFLAGHSAGAYNAVMLALDHSFFHDAGVTLTVKAVAGLSGPYDFYPFEYSEVENSSAAPPIRKARNRSISLPQMTRRSSLRPAPTTPSCASRIHRLSRKNCAPTAIGSRKNTTTGSVTWNRCSPSARSGAGALRCSTT